MRVNLSNLRLIQDIKIENVSYGDYPDFVDAFIGSASWSDSGVELTEEELDTLNNKHTDFVQEQVMSWLF